MTENEIAVHKKTAKAIEDQIDVLIKTIVGAKDINLGYMVTTIHAIDEIKLYTWMLSRVRVMCEGGFPFNNKEDEAKADEVGHKLARELKQRIMVMIDGYRHDIPPKQSPKGHEPEKDKPQANPSNV